MSASNLVMICDTRDHVDLCVQLGCRQSMATGVLASLLSLWALLVLCGSLVSLGVAKLTVPAGLCFLNVVSVTY